jgi:hypothetical protein
MNRPIVATVGLALLLAVAGCGTLLPKRVEFFQKKVKPLPEATPRQVERLKQAAYAAEKSATATVEAATRESCSTNVLGPARSTERLTSAVSLSLGPPKSPARGDGTALADQVVKDVAELNSNVAAYREKLDPLVGKKIEGTGWFQIGYVTYIGVIIGILALIWVALKIYGTINPVVGLGTQVFGRVSSSIAAQGFSELVKGGQEFKKYLAESGLDAAVQAKVLDLFTRAHKETQTPASTQVLVKNLINPRPSL